MDSAMDSAKDMAKVVATSEPVLYFLEYFPACKSLLSRRLDH